MLQRLKGGVIGRRREDEMVGRYHDGQDMNLNKAPEPRLY